MDDLAICLNVHCGVYVFGHAAEGCPGCQGEGKPFQEEHQNTALTRIYREVQNS